MMSRQEDLRPERAGCHGPHARPRSNAAGESTLGCHSRLNAALRGSVEERARAVCGGMQFDQLTHSRHSAEHSRAQIVDAAEGSGLGFRL